MSRKFDWKVLKYPVNETGERLMTVIDISSGGYFDIGKVKVGPRNNEANRFMSDRNEGGYNQDYRLNESTASRHTTTYAGAGILEQRTSRRDNDTYHD